MTAFLSVNVDHVATLRQARQAAEPDPVTAALAAERAGATGITVHLRQDRRHIQDRDVERLRERIGGKLNLEMASRREMLDLAVQFKPDQVTLVPETASEITTEGGLNISVQGPEVRRAALELAQAGIAVSIFLDPNPGEMGNLLELVAEAEGAITGCELNTDRYSRATGSEAATQELEHIRSAARQGCEALRMYAGHGLTLDNVYDVADTTEIEELNIGHSIVARAVQVGMEAAVGEMLAAVRTEPAAESSGPSG